MTLRYEKYQFFMAQASLKLSDYFFQTELYSESIPICTVKSLTLVNFMCVWFYFLDEIPVRGFIGHLEEGGFLPHNHKIFLWAHLSFHIEYNGDQVSIET